MEYSNERIEQLKAERSRIDEEIRREIEKEKARYKINWKRVAAMVLTFVFLIFAYNVNLKIFPKTSIWSWEYYFGKLK